MIKSLLSCCFFVLLAVVCRADDGYRLWLRYDKIDDNGLLQQYRNQISTVYFNGNSPVVMAAKNELEKGLGGLLDKKIIETGSDGASILVFKKSVAAFLKSNDVDYSKPGKEGFFIISSGKKIIITANSRKIMVPGRPSECIPIGLSEWMIGPVSFSVSFLDDGLFMRAVMISDRNVQECDARKAS